MRRLVLLWAALMAGITAAFAEDVTFKADAPDAVVSGEQFRLTYTVNTHDVKDFRAPSMEGFNVLMGPSSSRQSSTNIINGKRSLNTIEFILATVAASSKFNLRAKNPTQIYAHNGKTTENDK